MRPSSVRQGTIGSVAAFLALTASSIVSAGSLPAGAATAGPAVGAVADITWGTSATEVDRSIAAMSAAGIGWVRANVAWSGGEPDAKGVLNTGYLASIDQAVAKAHAAGMKVLMPISDGVPYWASADPAKYQSGSAKYWNPYWRPASFADYAAFVKTVVARYSAMGVHTFELWNEPNLTRFWPSGPNAVEFASLLAAAYPAVKQADPTATVVMGGLSKNDYTYLENLYKAGGRPYFDAVAVHPYTGLADPTWCWNQGGTTKKAVDAFCGIEEVRRTMEAYGDSAKGMWLTEFGWSTGTSAYSVSEAAQADFLAKAFTKLSSYPYVHAAFWYSLRNVATVPEDYEANLGLLRRDFSEKPAYGALRSLTGGPVADTSAPVLSGIAVGKMGTNSATVTWTTDTPATSRVDAWSAAGAVTVVSQAALVTSHGLVLSGLASRTTYSFRVNSTDTAGNTVTSGVYSFTTRK
jgi:hypothetical protein